MCAVASAAVAVVSCGPGHVRPSLRLLFLLSRLSPVTTPQNDVGALVHMNKEICEFVWQKKSTRPVPGAHIMRARCNDHILQVGKR